MTESELQQTIKDALKAKGYLLLDTSVRGKGVAMRHGRMTGSSKGIPDLFVSHPKWYRAAWFGVEIKLPKGEVKPEQQALLNLDRIIIVRSLEEALEGVQALFDEMSVEGSFNP